MKQLTSKMKNHQERLANNPKLQNWFDSKLDRQVGKFYKNFKMHDIEFDRTGVNAKVTYTDDGEFKKSVILDNLSKDEARLLMQGDTYTMFNLLAGNSKNNALQEQQNKNEAAKRTQLAQRISNKIIEN